MRIRYSEMIEAGKALGLYDLVKDEWIFLVKGGELRLKHPPKTTQVGYFHVCEAKDLEPR